MKRGRKRIFNFRPLVVIALGVLLVLYIFPLNKGADNAPPAGYADETAQAETVETGKPSFPERARGRVKDALDKYAPADTAALMYAMLFGDKTGLSMPTYTAFQFSGLAHILAVSGLHVGMLAYSLHFILRKLRAKPWVVFGVTAAVLGFYCGLCSFAAGVVRASVMSAVFLFSKAIHKRYDPLNALAFAALVISAFNAASVYTLSFKMSFMCMLSLIAFMPVFKKLYGLRRIGQIYARNKITRAVGDAFALTFCAQLGALPLTVGAFGYAASYGIFANILAAPFLAAAVCLLYAAAFLSMIFPFMSFTAAAAGWAFEAVKFIAKLFSCLPYAAVTLIAAGAALAALYALYLIIVVCGRFFMCNKGIKWGTAVLAAVVFVTGLAVANRPLAAPPQVVMPDCGYNYETIVTYEKSAVYAGAVNSYNARKIKNYFFGLHIRKIDAVALTEFKADDAKYLKELVNLFKPEYVYAPDVDKVTDYGALTDACAYSKLIPVGDARDRAAGGMLVRYAVWDKKLVGVNFYVAGQNISVIYQKKYDDIKGALWAFPDNISLLIARADLREQIPCVEFFQCYDYAQFSNGPRGNFTYNLLSGIIGIE